MSDLVKQDPTAFVLADRHSDFKLSVETTNYLLQIASSHELKLDLEASHGLWLQSPGLCQFQICVEKDGIVVKDQYTLEHIAATIISCPLWQELSLLAEIEEIHFEASDNEPNIYLTVEHQDKSNALLAPNYMARAQFVGLHCLLNFRGDICVAKGPIPSRTVLGSSPPTMITDEINADLFWNRLDEFLIAALREIVGVRKKLVGMKRTKIGPGSSLAETAPAVWNANYLENIAEHAKQLPLISSILASCTQAHNPSLRHKAIAMFCSQEPNLAQVLPVESTVQKLLWEQVLKNTKALQLKPRTITKETTGVALNGTHGYCPSNRKP